MPIETPEAIRETKVAVVNIPSAEERTRKRAAALKYADDGRLATLSELGDERRDLT
jgi:flavin reductase (DIM6/NTAB) family NADH-FMN oxidoreductase RutF